MRLKYQCQTDNLWESYVLKKTYEKFAVIIERFIQKVEDIPHLKGGKKTGNKLLDHQRLSERGG